MAGYIVGAYLVVSVPVGVILWSALVVAKRADQVQYREDNVDIPEDMDRQFSQFMRDPG